LLIFTGARRFKFTTAAICSISEASTPHARSAARILCFRLRPSSSSASPLSSLKAATCRLLPSKQTEESAVKARREGQGGPQIVIPRDLFAKVTETISVDPTIGEAPHRASLHAYRLPYEYKGSKTFAVQGRGCRGYCYCSWAGNCRFWICRKHRSRYERLFDADNGFAALASYRVTASAVFRGYFVDT
jgi:hypothetical protein